MPDLPWKGGTPEERRLLDIISALLTVPKEQVPLQQQHSPPEDR